MARPRKIIDSRKLKSLYEKGMTYYELSQKFNTNPTTICRHLIRENIKRNRKKKDISDALIKKLYLSGKGTSTIEKKVALTHSNIINRLKKMGVRIKARSEYRAPNYNGGRTVKFGYVYVLQGKRYVQEHRLIMEKKLDRKLKRCERVHHLDGNRQNNDPKNLALCKNESVHQRQYHASRKRR